MRFFRQHAFPLRVGFWVSACHRYALLYVHGTLPPEPYSCTVAQAKRANSTVAATSSLGFPAACGLPCVPRCSGCGCSFECAYNQSSRSRLSYGCHIHSSLLPLQGYSPPAAALQSPPTALGTWEEDTPMKNNVFRCAHRRCCCAVGLQPAPRTLRTLVARPSVGAAAAACLRCSA